MGRSVLDKQVFLYLPCFQETESWHDRNTSVTLLSSLCSCCSLGSYSSSWWFAIMFENQQKKQQTGIVTCSSVYKQWNSILKAPTVDLNEFERYHILEIFLRENPSDSCFYPEKCSLIHFFLSVC